MKKHTTEQIIRKLREGETLEAQGKGIAEVCQTLEISSQTYHRWKKRYGKFAYCTPLTPIRRKSLSGKWCRRRDSNPRSREGTGF